MSRISLKAICIVLALNSCTDYVWNLEDISNFEATLNQQVGKDFSQTYPRSGKNNLINETEIFKEYIQDKYDDCSWIVKVENQSNKIHSWHYAYSARCTRTTRK